MLPQNPPSILTVCLGCSERLFVMECNMDGWFDDKHTLVSPRAGVAKLATQEHLSDSQSLRIPAG